MTRSTILVRVAVFAPLAGEFDYLLETEASRLPRPGQRVRVPFGRSSRIAVITALPKSTPMERKQLKPVEALLDEIPLFPSSSLELLRWVSHYYHYPYGESLAMALPVNLRKGKPWLEPGPVAVALTPLGEAQDGKALSRAPRQRRMLEYLKEQGGVVGIERLREHFSPAGATLKALFAKGLIETLDALPAAEPEGRRTVPSLNQEQAEAVEAIVEGLGDYTVCLLDGVTGSGKTEVYLRAIEQVLARDQRVMVLVPEIGLTPQLVERFERRFGACLALSHSGLSHGERQRAWQQAASGRARILIGTRSAVFTPLPALGLIVVDEEHDASYKQQEGCRYSARDIAILRARRERCPVVLGSATPSFESLRNALEGRYRHLVLNHRAGNARPPRIRLLDARGLKADEPFGREFLDAIQNCLARDEQVMLFVNRRGYAPVWMCYDCNWVAECRRCDARMTVHRHERLLWCHHCGFRQALPTSCPECGGTNLNPLGQGTQRIERRLAECLPEHPILRIDRDSMSARGKLEKSLSEIKEGKYSLLVGTQLLSKGHHFPNVTLVAIPDIDSGLFGIDFRATERLAQLIVQVAGRAGRADKRGEVLIQTRYPEHPLLQLLLAQGYRAFARVAMRERREAGFPPYTYQALLRASSPKQPLPMAFLDEATGMLAGLSEARAVSHWGPVPPPMARRAGRYRAQLLLQADDRASLQALLRVWLPAVGKLPSARRVRWAVDVDPIDLY